MRHEARLGLANGMVLRPRFPCWLVVAMNFLPSAAPGVRGKSRAGGTFLRTLGIILIATWIGLWLVIAALLLEIT